MLDKEGNHGEEIGAAFDVARLISYLESNQLRCSIRRPKISDQPQIRQITEIAFKRRQD